MSRITFHQPPCSRNFCGCRLCLTFSSPSPCRRNHGHSSRAMMILTPNSAPLQQGNERERTPLSGSEMREGWRVQKSGDWVWRQSSSRPSPRLGVSAVNQPSRSLGQGARHLSLSAGEGEGWDQKENRKEGIGSRNWESSTGLFNNA